MALEMLEKPRIQVEDGTTCHIYAIDTIDENSVPEESIIEPALPKAIGYVAMVPSRMARYMDDDRRPYMIHKTMVVKGIVGGQAVYDKTVSPKGFMGWPKPLYDLRISLARKRASRRVVSILS